MKNEWISKKKILNKEFEGLYIILIEILKRSKK